jgi:sphinganine-1-phosphate aldolase
MFLGLPKKEPNYFDFLDQRRDLWNLGFATQVTSGGTESIFLACLAYRNWAREERGIDVPEIITPNSAHAAFEKSANILGMRIRKVACDPVSFRVDLKAMKRAINRNTCMVRTKEAVFE